MEEFRKKIINQRKLYLALAIITVILFIAVNIYMVSYSYNNPDLNNLHYKFLIKSKPALTVVLVTYIINYTNLGNCLKNDVKLKKMYTENSDIRIKNAIVDANTATIAMILMLSAIGMFVSSLYNSAIFYTIMVYTVVVFIIYLLSFLYYRKKYLKNDKEI